MIRFVEILGRFAMIVLGFAGAIAAAGLMLAITLSDMAGREVAEAAPAILLTLLFIIAYTGYASFLPAMTAIAIGEVLGKRDWAYYLASGAIVAAVVIGLFLAEGVEEAEDPEFILSFLAAGLTGGWIYWLIAGRNAGRWREPNRPISPPPSGS